MIPRQINTNKSGSALILTILTITTIMVAVLSFCKLTVPFLYHSTAGNDTIVAESAAQTGIDMAETFLTLTPNPPNQIFIDIESATQAAGCNDPKRACIAYDIASTSPSYDVTVTGHYANIQRTYRGTNATGSWTWSPVP